MDNTNKLLDAVKYTNKSSSEKKQTNTVEHYYKLYK